MYVQRRFKQLISAWFHTLCTKDTTVMFESWHGITGVIYYIYSHCGFGRACASAQSRPSLHCLKMVNMVEGWHGASLVLFITCTIIEGLVGPAHVRSLYHACTGCIQKAEMHYLMSQVYSNYFQCEIHEQINLGRVYSMRSKFCGKCI